MSLLIDRASEIFSGIREGVFGSNTVLRNDTGVVRFEKGRTAFSGEVDGIPVGVDVRKGQIQITLRKPTGETLKDGTPIYNAPVQVSAHVSGGKNIPAVLNKETTYF